MVVSISGNILTEGYDQKKIKGVIRNTMNKTIKTIVVIGVLTILLGFGLDTAALGEVEANGGDDFAVSLFDGKPTSFVSLDGSDFPVLVATITANTSEGPVTITLTIEDYFEDILFGYNEPLPETIEDLEDRDGEHIVAKKGTWDFGGGDTLSVDTRIYIWPVIEERGGCDEFIPNDIRAVVTGGTGRFANALGNIQLVIKPFFFSDLDVGPVKIKGSIEGLVVLPR